MLLKVIVDDQQLALNVPDVIVEGAQDFFAQMDRDMDAGWQMGREWVEHLDVEQRCQVVADKLPTALETENEKLGRMMAAYIVARLPHVETIIKGYTASKPEVTAKALRKYWLGFAPNKGIELIKAEQREQFEAIGIPIPTLKAIGHEIANTARQDVNGFIPLAQLLWDEYGREGRVVR